MPFEDARLRIGHMLEAIDAIRTYAGGKVFNVYTSDPMLRDAIERNIERLSEASRRIPDALKGRVPEIPWRSIAGIGNVLRHDYDGVDNEIIWNLVREDLVPLRQALTSLLREIEGA